MMNAYIFDMDGTFLDSIEFWKNFGTEILKSLGINEKIPPKTLEKFTLHEAVVYISENYPVGKTIEEIEDGLSELMYSKYRNDFLLKEGSLELFRLIKEKGHLLAISTATERRYMQGVLEKYPEVKDLMDVVDCVEIGGPTKKDTKYFCDLFERFDERPDKIFFFEDSPYSMKTAKDLGWTIIAITEDTNPHLLDEAREYSHYLFDSLKDVDIDILEL